MSDKNNRCCSDSPRESVCIDTNRVYDSCKDRDCMEDMRVYLNAADQLILDSAVNIKPIEAEIINTFIDVEPLQFNRGCFTVDVRFFIKSAYDVFTGPFRPQKIEGLSVFDKRVILFGSEGEARTFSSVYMNEGPDIPLPPEPTCRLLPWKFSIRFFSLPRRWKSANAAAAVPAMLPLFRKASTACSKV